MNYIIYIKIVFLGFSIVFYELENRTQKKLFVLVSLYNAANVKNKKIKMLLRNLNLENMTISLNHYGIERI